MNNLYHRFAVASVGIALGFALGANKEAKAARFTFTSTRSFWVVDTNQDGVGDDGSDYPAGERYTGLKLFGDDRQLGEYRSFYQFNSINSLPLGSNTRITSAILTTPGIYDTQNTDRYTSLNVYGYTETEIFQSLFDNDNEKYVGGADLRYIYEDGILTSNILGFINQRIGNNNSFWLGIRPSDEAFVALPLQTSLIITTEPVPEPTTIFGSALALGVGGWLKRKKSSQQNKTTSLH